MKKIIQIIGFEGSLWALDKKGNLYRLARPGFTPPPNVIGYSWVKCYQKDKRPT